MTQKRTHSTIKLFGRRFFYASWLLLYFLYRLLTANVKLAWDILKPNPGFEPAIFAYRNTNLTTGQLLALANIISLTPGSLTVDLNSEKSVIYVHSLYAREYEQTLSELHTFSMLIEKASGEMERGSKT